MAKGKIIVMRLFGGLGNQLFQYAFLFALSRQGGKARLEASSYEHDDKRVCELHHFRVSLPIEGGPPPWAFRKSRIPACLRSLFAAPKYPHFREEKRHGFDPGLAAPPRRHTYFKGYFQTEQYFLHCREQLCREFRLKTPLTPENARILEDIRSCCSISLHIRRTDYLSNPYLSPPPLEYYLRSMAEMEGRLRAAGAPQESLRYFIFSDDIEWARQNLRPALPHVHVDINDGGTGYFDLELMRNYRHHIIANSTFSWWAAWLNEHAEKIITAFNAIVRETASSLPGAVLSDHHDFMQGARYIDPFHFSPPDRAYQAGKTAGLLLPLLSARQEPPKEQECPKTRPEP